MPQYSHTQILEMVESALQELQLPSEPLLLYSPISYSLEGGGKRIRPVLLLLTYNIFDQNIEKAIPAAVAVEVFHNFTLLHDDIMDHALIRRGRQSVQAKWGENVAILSGDAMLIKAYNILQNIDSSLLPKVLTQFNTLAAEVCEGQQYDMDFEGREKVSVVDYMNMIELKTSALLRGATLIGAIMGGANSGDIDHLSTFSTQLGLAFQLEDDLLDSFGDERLGKKIGGDILEGKQTFLMISAFSHANKEQRELLNKTHLRTDITDSQKIDIIKSLYSTLGVDKLTRAQIQLHFNKAMNALKELSVQNSQVEALTAYASTLIGRYK